MSVENASLPKVQSLKKFFESLDKAIDSKDADKGKAYYGKAKKKTLTLKKMNRQHKYQDLKSLFEKPSPKAPTTEGTSSKQLLTDLLNELSLANEKVDQTDDHNEEIDILAKEERKSGKFTLSFETNIDSPDSPWVYYGENMTEDDLVEWEQELESIFVKSDNDVAEILMDVVHEHFYNPYTGLWKDYDILFDKESFTSLGLEGWDSPLDTDERIAAREHINKKKNIELDSLMESDFVLDAIDQIFGTMFLIVSGVTKQEVRRAIRNHIRAHLYHLIYFETDNDFSRLV